MERNLERQTLSFSKGMTNVPSDLLSDDSELLESDGFIFKDGEMKAVQKGVEIGNVPYKIMYVHKMADYENIIAYDGTTNIYWYTKDDSGNIVSPPDGVAKSFNVGNVYDVNSIGNTLVCSTSEGIHYLLYKGNKYKDLGKELPTPDVSFVFNEVENPFQANEGRTALDVSNFLAEYKTTNVGFYYNERGELIASSSNAPSSYAYKYSQEYGVHTIENSKLQDFRNAVQGHVAEAINWAKNKGYFCFPFFVRYAIRLYDGTYARISNPIICYPTISKNCEICWAKADESYTDNTGKLQWLGNIVRDNVFLGTFANYFYFIHCTKMSCMFNIDNLGDWKDIVKDIVVFATDDVLPFELDGDKWTLADNYKKNGEVLYNTIINDNYIANKTDFHVGKNLLSSSIYDDQTNPYQSIEPTYKNEVDIKEELLQKTQFYKLFSLDVNSSMVNTNKFYDVLSSGTESALLKSGILKNLEEQEQLKVDDYYGWTYLTSSKLFSYNNRINLIGAKRYPFKGFAIFKAGYTSPTTAYGFVKYYVHIVSQTMDTWVSSNALLIGKDYQPYNDWYYYPDPNAKEMIIMVNKYQEGKTYYYNINLRIHPMLNGSYSFVSLPPTLLATGKDAENKQTGGFEDLNSQIFTSVVNNPFVFEASGDNTVGTGKILGIIANTEAVSQGQFGQYPLMVFTDEGIYGLSVNSEGLYSRAYPISREVCNEDSPLVPTDRLVFFASKKGLMAASGGNVACMSEQMRGRVPRNFATFGEGKFLDFLKGCFIAYDYRDSILRIFSKGKSYQYIYNMVDKTFSMVNSGIEAQAVVNDYPDNLIQDTNGNVYSLTSKPDINEDTESYSGSFTTRPLKLGGSMTLKSLRAVKHLFDSDEGTIGLEIYGSNDCKHWCKLPSLAGKPWKYFTFKYTLQNFKAADSFAGSIVEVQSRREDKMR